MKKNEGTSYNQTATYEVNPKYDFIYKDKTRDLFTREQVSIILDKVNDTLGLLHSPEDSIEATQDLIYWLKRDLLDRDK